MEGSSIHKSYHKQVNVKILFLSFSKNLAMYSTCLKSFLLYGIIHVHIKLKIVGVCILNEVAA